MSRKNPYSPKFVTRHGEPLAENLRFRGQNSHAIAASGSLNASSKRDLISQIGNLIETHKNGDIMRNSVLASRVSITERKEIARERKSALIQAIADTSGETMKALGEVMVEDIHETTGREGFIRKLLAFKELEQGEFARVRFRTKDVIAFTAATPTSITPVFVRNNFKDLPEFYVGSRILMEEREIHHSTGDILEEKYQEGLEAIMTQEDRIWKRMADEASVAVNTPTYFSTFTPMHFRLLKTEVSQWGIAPAYCILALNLWDDITATQGFSEWFDPIHQHEIVLEGELGTLMGVSLLTDGFRLPELQVLNPGEIYMVGSPETHGALQQRGDLSSNPIHTYDEGSPNRGWYIFEMIATAIVNAKSVAAGKRN